MERTHSQLPAVLYSLSRDSAVNLAIEESLLSMVQTGQKFLFLYENNSAVIFGRFQNPWKECRTGLVRRSETVFRRRISGGGTVVHGPGNLNFSIISGSSTPDKEGNLKGVIRALSGIGVEIEMNDRFDLLIRKLPEPGGGVFKVSGSAFRQTSRGSIHHATLLVNANLENLGIFLRPLKRIIETRSVASVPSPVANLGEISSGLTVMDVVGALSEEWGFPGGASELNPSFFDDIHDFQKAYHRLISSEWIWGRTPKFKEIFTGLSGLEDIRLEIDVREGRISGVESQNRIDTGFLIGCPYHGSDILNTSGSMARVWLEDLARLVDGD